MAAEGSCAFSMAQVRATGVPLQAVPANGAIRTIAPISILCVYFMANPFHNELDTSKIDTLEMKTGAGQMLT